MNLALGFITLCCLALIHCQGDKSAANIHFPSIGRDGTGIREVKGQLIPFPRPGKQTYWRYPGDPYVFDYEDIQYPIAAVNPSSHPSDPSSPGMEERFAEKRDSAGSGGMWFGPRMGKRRKRSIELESSSERTREEVDTKTLVKILRNFNWAIVPLKSKNLSSRNPTEN